MIAARLSLRSALALTGLAMALAISLAACRQKPQAPSARYTVRGAVASLPIAGDPTTELRVHHEAIPSFRASWPDGPLGMKSMTMPFPLGEGVSLEGLKIGDPVELTFAVDYDAKSGSVLRYRATAVKPLPADTVLDFGGGPRPTSPPAE